MLTISTARFAHKAVYAIRVFYRDIVATIKDDCTPLDTKTMITDSSVFLWEVYAAAVAVWIILYFIVWRGIFSLQAAVWVIVPLPIIFIVVMLVNNVMLDGADVGIGMYLGGYDAEGNSPDFGAQLVRGKMWAQACGQVFFSLGLCMGTMTNFSSYNPKNQPLIGDTLKIAFLDTLVSFLSGFAVFSVIGYLMGLGLPIADQSASIGLAFVAYPAAVETMPMPNLWAILLASTLLLLGLSTSQASLSVVTHAARDSELFYGWPEQLISVMFVVLGALCSLVYCFNWGFTFFEVLDNYLNTYLILILGLLKVMAATWVYEADQVCRKGRNYKVSLLLFTTGFWLLVLIVPFNFHFIERTALGIGLFWLLVAVVALISYRASDLSYEEWKSNIAFCGIRKLSLAITKRSKRAGDRNVYRWEIIFENWWCFSVKYWTPFTLSSLLAFSLKEDIVAPFGGYNAFWQQVGGSFVVAGLLVFFVSLCVCTKPEPFKDDPYFDEMDKSGVCCTELSTKYTATGNDSHRAMPTSQY